MIERFERTRYQDHAVTDRREISAIPSDETHRPGVEVGSTSEFSLFFRVRPGHENDLRQAVEALQVSPGYRPGDYDLPIAVIHEARFVPFDGDTRLLSATSFDGPWDAYMQDFASKPLQLFDSIFRHVEGCEGLPDLRSARSMKAGSPTLGTPTIDAPAAR